MTLKEILTRTVERRRGAVALRFKRDDRWHVVTYFELLERVWRVSEVLARLGVRHGDRVALFRENSPEWPEIYFGIVSLGAIAVPIDAKLQEQEVSHILRDSGAGVLFCDAGDLPMIREIEAHIPDLRHVMLLGTREALPAAGRRLAYTDYERAVEEAAEDASSGNRAFDKMHPAENDIASFIYTSGTTGRQKGAMLTHRNFASNVEGAMKAIDIYPADNFLLVLPLHHSFAFTTNLILPVAVGSEISFVESLKTVGDNIREVSPTVLIGVPLLLEKMYNRIWNGLKEKKLAYALFRLGLKKPVIRGIAQKLGGKLRLVVSGGAPCDPELLVNYTNLGIEIIEGYGLTETAPVLSLNPMGRQRPGSVGVPLPGVEIRILDPNPEGIGEIAARGPNIMKGYFNNREATDAVFRDGWFLTGDMGFIDKDGYVTITGRKKSLIVNREGKNVYPEEVEHQVCKSPFVREALVLGYRDADMKVGEQVGLIVVPNQETLDDHARKAKKSFSEKELEDLVRADVKRVAAEIAEYKRPRRIQIRWEEFEKTSTGKVKRYLYSMEPDEMG